MDLGTSWDDLLFRVQRAARYHRRRMRLFDRVGKWASGLSVVFSSAAMASLLPAESYDTLAALAALVVVIVQTFDLTIGSSKAAREHSELARRYVALEAQMVQLEAHSPKALAAFEAKRLMIEADEPPVPSTMLDGGIGSRRLAVPPPR